MPRTEPEMREELERLRQALVALELVPREMTLHTHPRDDRESGDGDDFFVMCNGDGVRYYHESYDDCPCSGMMFGVARTKGAFVMGGSRYFPALEDHREGRWAPVWLEEVGVDA